MIVIDTHVLVWWVSEPSHLSAKARRGIASEAGRGPIVVSAISILEITTAVRRGRLSFNAPIEEWLGDVRSLPEVRIEPMDAAIAELAGSYDESLPGDPADRIIMATAQVLNAKLVTADQRLRKQALVPTLW